MCTEGVDVNDLAFRYAALSHCWGPREKQPLKTMESSYDAHRREILHAALPRTFQEAVWVARALHIRYLWIDSLCIIQDNMDDWMVEAAKMAHVYQGSYVTLAATGSSDSSGGLFSAPLQPAVAVTIDPSDYGFPDRPPKTCYARMAASRLDMWDSPLARRAWVLQEQILSTRIVHFAARQMYFRCPAGLESEDGTWHEPEWESTVSGYMRRFPMLMDSTAAAAPPDWGNGRFALARWWSWVPEYTERALTFHADRLAAVAGITNDYSAKTGDAPVLGLWARTLWFDLAWQYDVNRSRAGPVAQPRIDTSLGIPSWSWLSLRPELPVQNMVGALVSRLDEITDRLQVVDWSVDWSGGPYTSPLEKTRLVVCSRGRRLDAPLPQPRGRSVLEINYEVDWDVFLYTALHLDGPLTDEERQDVVLLLIFTDVIYEYLLILKRVDGQADAYRRLGAGSVSRPRGRAGYFHGAQSMQLCLV